MTTWKLWHSGYANTPFVVYEGEKSPSLDRMGSLQMNGSIKIAEVMCDESQAHPQQIANANAITAVPLMLQALNRAEQKLNAYIGVRKGDKELTETVLPLVQMARSEAFGRRA